MATRDFSRILIFLYLADKQSLRIAVMGGVGGGRAAPHFAY